MDQQSYKTACCGSVVGDRVTPEYKFHAERKWRFDWAIPAIKLAVEYEGGIFQAKSGHNTARHYTKDADKYNSAVAVGWRVLRFTAMNYKNLTTELNNTLNQLHKK